MVAYLMEVLEVVPGTTSSLLFFSTLSQDTLKIYHAACQRAFSIIGFCIYQAFEGEIFRFTRISNTMIDKNPCLKLLSDAFYSAISDMVRHCIFRLFQPLFRNTGRIRVI